MKQYALITGGELRNRGAQAMTFRTVAAVKALLPNLEPVLVSKLDARPTLMQRLRGVKAREDYDNLAFRIIWGGFELLPDYPYPDPAVAPAPKTRMKQCLLRHGETRELDRILGQTALCLDISGFALGSQWGYRRCQSYLSRIELLDERSIPVYLLPQSFGPFEFDGPAQTERIRQRASSMLQKPRMVFAREHQGYDDLLSVCPDARCMLSEDLVLQGSEIDLDDVFKDASRIPACPSIETTHNVGIVPNARTFEHGDAAWVLALYEAIVRELLDAGYQVYVIRHSEDDGGCCAQIKAAFSGDPRVKLLAQERYCFQYEELFKTCNFLIASRFHSIVHAYRCGVPCVALGWATKYVELLNRFGQGEFVHDVRTLSDAELSQVVGSVRKMEASHADASRTISARVRQIQEAPSVFDLVARDYQEVSASWQH